MNIKFLTDKEKKLSRSLYEEAFSEDSEKFVDYFYENEIGANEVTGLYNPELISMIHLHPLKLRVGKNVADTYYMLAVATKLSHRKKGYYSTLLSYTLNEIYDKVAFVFLKPAAVGIYSPFGFKVLSRTKSQIFGAKEETTFEFEKIEKLTANDLEFSNRLLTNYQAIIRDEDYATRIIPNIKAQNGHLYRVLRDEVLVGFVRTTNEDRLLVSDILSPLALAKDILQEFATYLELDEIEVELSLVQSKKQGEIELLHMYRIVNLEKFIGILKPNRDIDLRLKVEDGQIEKNNVTLHIKSVNGRYQVVKSDSFEKVMDIGGVLEFLLSVSKTFPEYINEVV